MYIKKKCCRLGRTQYYYWISADGKYRWTLNFFAYLLDSESDLFWNPGINLQHKRAANTCIYTIILWYIPDTREFDFTTLLHTYIRVNNVETTTVSNLTGLKYIDKVRGSLEWQLEWVNVMTLALNLLHLVLRYFFLHGLVVTSRNSY